MVTNNNTPNNNNNTKNMDDRQERRVKWTNQMKDIVENEQRIQNPEDTMDYDHSSELFENNSPVFGNGDNNRILTSFPNEHENVVVVVKYVVSCTIGTEKYVAAEILEKLSCVNDDDEKWQIITRPWQIAGYVACVLSQPNMDRVEMDHVRDSLLKLRSAFHVLEYHDHFHLRDVPRSNDISKDAVSGMVTGEDLYQFYKKRLQEGTVQFPCLQKQQQTQQQQHSNNKNNKNTSQVFFRVSTERIGGPHSFTAPNVEREIGGALSEFYADTCIPKMKDYDVNIRVDVIGQQVILGIQCNNKNNGNNNDNMSKRRSKDYHLNHGISIKCNLAYIMIRLANLPVQQQQNQSDATTTIRIMDPFCGSGTLLIEACQIYQNVHAIGLDVSNKSAKAAQHNASADSKCGGNNNDNNNNNHCEFHHSDARAIRKFAPGDESVDAIVSNLPWGVCTGNTKSVSDLQQLYEVFFRTAWYVLKDKGRIVVLVLRGLQVTRLLQKLTGKYRILQVTVINTRNNLPTIIVVEKISHDIIYDSIKSQLAYVGQFTKDSLSKDMYHAIHEEHVE